MIMAKITHAVSLFMLCVIIAGCDVASYFRLSIDEFDTPEVMIKDCYGDHGWIELPRIDDPFNGGIYAHEFVIGGVTPTPHYVKIRIRGESRELTFSRIDGQRCFTCSCQRTISVLNWGKSEIGFIKGDGPRGYTNTIGLGEQLTADADHLILTRDQVEELFGHKCDEKESLNR